MWYPAVATETRVKWSMYMYIYIIIMKNPPFDLLVWNLLIPARISSLAVRVWEWDHCHTQYELILLHCVLLYCVARGHAYKYMNFTSRRKWKFDYVSPNNASTNTTKKYLMTHLFQIYITVCAQSHAATPCSMRKRRSLVTLSIEPFVELASMLLNHGMIIVAITWVRVYFWRGQSTDSTSVLW